MPLHGKLTSVGVVGNHVTGTGSLTVVNTPISPAWRAFDASMDGLTMTCRLSHTTSLEEEVFEGVFTWSTLTLTRAKVISSSNNGNKVSFSSGNQELGTVLTIEDVRRKPEYGSSASPLVLAALAGDTAIPVGGGTFQAWRPSFRPAETRDLVFNAGTVTTLPNGAVHLAALSRIRIPTATTWPGSAMIMTASLNINASSDIYSIIGQMYNHTTGYGIIVFRDRAAFYTGPTVTFTDYYPAPLPSGLVTLSVAVNSGTNKWWLKWRSETDSCEFSVTLGVSVTDMSGQALAFYLGDTANLMIADFYGVLMRDPSSDIANIDAIMRSDMDIVERARTDVYSYRVETGASSGTIGAAHDETVGLITGTITVPAGLRNGWTIRRTNRSSSSQVIEGSGGLVVNGTANGQVTVPDGSVLAAVMVDEELDVQVGTLATVA